MIEGHIGHLALTIKQRIRPLKEWRMGIGPIKESRDDLGLDGPDHIDAPGEIPNKKDAIETGKDMADVSDDGTQFLNGKLQPLKSRVFGSDRRKPTHRGETQDRGDKEDQMVPRWR